MDFNSNAIKKWSSYDVSPKESFDSWHSALNRFHLRWSLNKTEQPNFYGEILTKSFADIQFIHCKCDPCSGFRNPPDISKETEEYYGLLLVQQGSEIIRHLNNEVIVGPGDIFLWDTTRPLSFRLKEKLKKTTLFIPKPYLKEQSLFIDQLLGDVLPARAGLGAIVNSSLVALCDQMDNIDDQTYFMAANISIELITYWINRQNPLINNKQRNDLIQKILIYIEDHLSDPTLNPFEISKACHISIGYLHRLFSFTNFTVSKWIMIRRLESSKKELRIRKSSLDTITNIAYKWGFSDHSHFTKVFKRTYNMTPIQYQKKVNNS